MRRRFKEEAQRLETKKWLRRAEKIYGKRPRSKRITFELDSDLIEEADNRAELMEEFMVSEDDQRLHIKYDITEWYCPSPDYNTNKIEQ